MLLYRQWKGRFGVAVADGERVMALFFGGNNPNPSVPWGSFLDARYAQHCDVLLRARAERLKYVSRWTVIVAPSRKGVNGCRNEEQRDTCVSECPRFPTPKHDKAVSTVIRCLLAGENGIRHYCVHTGCRSVAWRLVAMAWYLRLFTPLLRFS